MAIFFTSDSHFGHTNILKYCNRPFSSIEEHDEALIENWNSVVTKKDTVYHLGDFGFYHTEHQLKKLMGRLTGRIYLILGNHDKMSKLKPVSGRFVWMKDVHFLKTHTESNGLSQGIFLSHYAHRTWPKSFRGAYHLFGHSHGNMPPTRVSFDCGVDCWNYFPISLEQVLNHFEKLNQENLNLLATSEEMK